MMNFDFSSLLSGLGQAFNEQEGSQQSAADPEAPTGVSSVNVTAHSPGLSPPSKGAINSVANAYDNRALVQGIDQVNQGQPQHHGMFGVRGTLRDVLGTLGDAFLIKDGHQPMYRPKVQAEQIGDATTGMSNDPAHAIERLRALGIPGADDLAAKYQEELNTQGLRKATLDNTAAYREGILGNRQDVLHDRQVNQASPYLYGMLNAAAKTNDPTKWAAGLAQAKAYGAARGIDIAKDLGIPDDMSQYMSGAGLTANQGQVASDKAATRATTERGQDVAAGSRVQAAQISAGARPSQDAILNRIIQKKSLADQGRGQPLTKTQQEVYDAYITRKNAGRAGGTLHFTPNGQTPGAPQPASPGGGKGKLVIRNGQIVSQ